MAESGARMIVAINATGFEPPRSSLPPKPPKIAANCAILATIMMVAATVAAIELIRMSRCFTCAQLVRDDTLQHPQNPLGRCHGSVLRIASGGKGVG